jgi:hypothetical protein
MSAWPLAARAQQAERVRRVGVLIPLAMDDPEAKARIAAFQQGLEQLGCKAQIRFIVSINGTIDCRESISLGSTLAIITSGNSVKL